jgi:hypothetical protein
LTVRIITGCDAELGQWIGERLGMCLGAGAALGFAEAANCSPGSSIPSPATRSPVRRCRSSPLRRGGGSSGGGGTTVNPVALANAQGIANIRTTEQQAGIQNANVNSPYGSSWWQPTATDPSTGLATSYQLNENLSPGLSNLFGGQVSLTQMLSGGAANQLLPQGLNFANMGEDTKVHRLFGSIERIDADQASHHARFSGIEPSSTSDQIGYDPRFTILRIVLAHVVKPP